MWFHITYFCYAFYFYPRRKIFHSDLVGLFLIYLEGNSKNDYSTSHSYFILRDSHTAQCSFNLHHTFHSFCSLCERDKTSVVLSVLKPEPKCLSKSVCWTDLMPGVGVYIYFKAASLFARRPIDILSVHTHTTASCPFLVPVWFCTNLTCPDYAWQGLLCKIQQWTTVKHWIHPAKHLETLKYRTIFIWSNFAQTENVQVIRNF